MTKESIEKLEKNEYFADVEKTIDYKLPVIEEFLRESPIVIVINGVRFSMSLLTVTRPTDDNNFRLMNQAFENIRRKYKKEQHLQFQ